MRVLTNSSSTLTHTVDLHGGDIPEALVPFVICRAGNDKVAKKSKAIAMAFGLPYVLTVSKPVQPSKGHRCRRFIELRGSRRTKELRRF